MRNLKKFLALVLAMIMAMSLMVSANALHAGTQYPDVEGNAEPAFEEAIEVLTGMGVYSGDSGNFKPTANITRAEVAALIYRLVTGDTTDARVGLYDEYPYGGFTDIPRGAWYGGYVGYCANADLIKGRSSTTFDPSGNVTGYEVLAMILRAIGYDKNGEFTGADWRVNVSATAQQLKILDNVKTTQYGGTLYLAARRDVVADLLFQAAAKVNMVNYTPAFGYQPYGDVNGSWGDLTGGVPNYTLGFKVFGLTSMSGVVVGNQATGEDSTLLSGSWKTGTGEPLKDEWGYVIKVDTKGTPATTDDVLVFRFKNNDISQGLNADWDKGATDNIIPYAGPSSTLVGTGDYEYTTGNPFNFDTGLTMFGHAAKVWYNVNSTSSKGYKTYAILDRATHTAVVYAADAVLSEGSATGDPTKAKLGQAAIDAGFKVQRDTDKTGSTAHFSDRYSQMDAAPAANGTTNASLIKTYALISNSDNKKVDVVIALSAEVGRIAEKNTTAATQYLTLGSTTPAASSFGNGTGANADRIFLDNLTDDTKEEQQAIGALVTAYQIVGTSFTLTQAASNAGIDTDAAWANVMYQLDPMKTETITVATYGSPATDITINTATPVITAITPAGGTTVNLSGITEGNKIISRALPIAVNKTLGTESAGLELVPLAGVTYTAYIDLVGRFISLVPVNDVKFVYGTYAGYELDGFNAGTIKYNMVGVDWNAEKQTENTIKFLGTVTTTNTTAISGTNYNTIAVTKKDQGQVQGSTNLTPGNEILTGINTGYMYDSATGTLYTDDLDGTAMAATTWTFTKNDATYGFKKVTSGSTDYLVTNDTEFIIVSGTGTATLKVESAKGITGLLAGGTSADITHTTWGGVPAAIKGTDNNVYFQTDRDLFGTTSTGGNAVITKVILSDLNLDRWNAQTLYFNFDQTTSTGAKLAGAANTVEQYALWNNGELGYYFIDTSVSTQVPASATATGTTWTVKTNVETKTFYTLSKIDDVNGVEVFKAVALWSTDGVDYTVGYNSESTSTNALTYKYITVNNLATGLLEKNGQQLVYTVGNAKVVDLEYKVAKAGNTALSPDRNEITNIRELNNAVSVKSSGATSAIYGIQVAVVYEGSEVSMIYVISVT